MKLEAVVFGVMQAVTINYKSTLSALMLHFAQFSHNIGGKYIITYNYFVANTTIGYNNFEEHKFHEFHGRQCLCEVS